MKQQVNFSMFVDAFRGMGRMDREDGKGGNFTYDGLRVLFDYLEALEQGTGEEMELDVIALCCEYSEDDPEYIAASYKDLSPEWDRCLADNEGAALSAVDDFVEVLSEHTSVCGVTPDGKIVYQQF